MKPFLRRDVKSVLFILAIIGFFVEIAFLCFANLNGRDVLSNSLTALVCLLSAISIGFVLQKERQQE
jgi:hypothetical protein